MTLLLVLASALALSGDSPFLSHGWTFDEADGASLYAHVCAACHQPDGRGASGAAAYPALAGDERLASTDYLIATLLGGQHAMPALGKPMSDTQVSDLVNYLRTRFTGVADDPATPARVAAARASLSR